MKKEDLGKVTVDLETYDMLREFKEQVVLGKIVEEYLYRDWSDSKFVYYTESEIIKKQADKINTLIDEIYKLRKKEFELGRLKRMTVRKFRKWKRANENN